ncbi:alpha/beta fold hydrolase [Streptomyces sp. NPDC001750]|uniref:alpha/beta fold hydrolase n=1 Tax=Streptomyces sp. NPDC001750 TaxID=3364607 RepID=UPI0036BEF31E
MTPKPSLLFVHGLGADGAYWGEVRGLLSRYESYAYDQRGHGKTPLGNEELTLDRLAGDLGAIVRSSPVPGPVVLVGHSAGGAAILRLAALESTLFGSESEIVGVVLVSASRLDLRCSVSGYPGRLLERALLSLPSIALRNERRGYFGRLTARGAMKAIRVISTWRWPLYGAGASRGARYKFSTMLSSTPPYTLSVMLGLLSRFSLPNLAAMRRVPVLIAAGEGDRIASREYMRLLSEELPSARLAVIPRAGHLLPLECPEELSREIQEFLDTLCKEGK